jgi:hypothetical protein
LVAETEWSIELIQDQGHRGTRVDDFVRGPRYEVRSPTRTAVVELKLGNVYVPSITDALGTDDPVTLLNLLDAAGDEIVRAALRVLAPGDLAEPPGVTAVYVDGEGVDVLVKAARDLPR